MAITAEEAIKWYFKMCDKEHCENGCEIGKTKPNGSCTTFCKNNPEEAVKAIERYKEKHSKTLAQDFFEKFPNAPTTDIGWPTVCPYQVGYENGKDALCRKSYCKRESCWGRLIDEIMPIDI